MLTINTWKDEDFKILRIKKAIKQLSIILLSSIIWFFIFSSICHASIIINSNIREIANIMFAEQSDYKATNALLNTYYKSKLKNETLEQSLKRQSCAYRYKSKQYLRARNNHLKIQERNIYSKILKQVQNFTPNKNWKYVKHESIHFYNSFDEMIIKLRQKWGDNIDYKHGQLIEGQYYFSRIK